MIFRMVFFFRFVTIHAFDRQTDREYRVFIARPRLNSAARLKRIWLKFCHCVGFRLWCEDNSSKLRLDCSDFNSAFSYNASLFAFTTYSLSRTRAGWIIQWGPTTWRPHHQTDV